MPKAARLSLGLLCLLAAASCDLGRADVVNRSPELGPAPGTPPVADAADISGDDASIDAEVTADAKGVAEDGGLDGGGDADVAPTLDRRDAPGPIRRDAPVARSDADCSGDAASRCSASALVLTDDFEDGAAGWISSGAVWTVTADSTSLRPNSVLSPTAPAASSVCYAEGAWQDTTAEVRLRVTSFGKAASTNRAEIYVRYQDAAQFYALSLRADQHLVLRRNASSLGAAAAVSVAEGGWHVLKIRVSGPAEAVSLEGYLDGVLMVVATDTEALLPARGTVGVGIHGETMAVFDDVSVSSP